MIVKMSYGCKQHVSSQLPVLCTAGWNAMLSRAAAILSPGTLDFDPVVSSSPLSSSSVLYKFTCKGSTLSLLTTSTTPSLSGELMTGIALLVRFRGFVDFLRFDLVDFDLVGFLGVTLLGSKFPGR